MGEHLETISWEETKAISIKIDLLTKDQITDLELTCRKAVSNKISKLKVILKELDIYVLDGQILANDKYGVAPIDFIEIVEAFGINIKQIQSNLKGKTYIIGDELIELTKILGANNLDLGISNLTLTKEIEELINDNKFSFDNIKEQYPKEIKDIISSIILNNEYSISESMKIRHEKVINNKKQVVRNNKTIISATSNENKVKETINNFFMQINSKITETNNNLRDGTIQILYSRAKKMGYNVEKVKKGNQVQLVLVRND